MGLGNPGLIYENTRHNAGFCAADILAKKLSCEFKSHKFESVIAEADFEGVRVMIAKPQTYMNSSGTAYTQITGFYKIPPENTVVIFDDITQGVGKIRIRRKGSAGGHNGIKDIIELSGTEEIPRIKIGVGERPDRSSDLKNWVLGKLPEEEREDYKKALENAADAALAILTDGIDRAMNKYSR